ncbi:unnamed protein product, partial [Scytosiphon promiscuus]
QVKTTPNEYSLRHFSISEGSSQVLSLERYHALLSSFPQRLLQELPRRDLQRSPDSNDFTHKITTWKPFRDRTDAGTRACTRLRRVGRKTTAIILPSPPAWRALP